MKEYLKDSLSTGITFGITMGIFFGIFEGLYWGIISGVILGTFFGTVLRIFIQMQKKKFKKIKASITDGKETIMDGAANHFKGKEAVGGWLYLTSEEVIFQSHAFNFQTHKTIVPLNKIVEVKAIKTFGLIPNGLQIIRNDSINEEFVVNYRRKWVQKINLAISSKKNVK